MVHVHRRAVVTLITLLLLAVGCGKAEDESPASADATTTSPGTDRPGDPEASPDPDPSWVYPDPEWQSIEPADAGFSTEGLDALANYAEGTNSSCLTVVKDGRLVDERYWNGFDAQTDQEIFSASKSVTSTLVGIAQDQGQLDIEEPASTYLTEWAGTDSEGITIRNLLSNDSGRYWDFATDYLEMVGSPDRTAFAIALDQQHDVGAEWVYNNSAIQTLEAVLERSTGQDMEEFAQENLFGPIGMTSTIMRDQAGNPAAFMGVQASCRDAARFGYLFMRDGWWDGTQVVSDEWVEEAISASQDLNTIYGYLWWRNSEGRRLNGITNEVIDDGSRWWRDAPLDAFAALGLGDQIVLVLPSEGIVVTRIGPYRQEEPGGIIQTDPNELARLVLDAETE